MDFGWQMWITLTDLDLQISLARWSSINMGIELMLRELINWLLSTLEVQPSTVEEIKSSQKDDAKLERPK